MKQHRKTKKDTDGQNWRSLKVIAVGVFENRSAAY